MHYTKSFLAAFAFTFALSLVAGSNAPAAAYTPEQSSIVYDDGTVVTVSREGYPDVH